MMSYISRIFFFLLFIVAFSLITPYASYASNNTSSITVINLVRSNAQGHEKDNLLSSLQAQWTITQRTHILATWLLQYSVLENSAMVNFMKTTMHGQEFGLLFEIDQNFANKSHVVYKNQGGPWYFSDSLLLPSYDIDERKRLIDTSFKKFKDTFGYYPKTVGAWWIGADSLTYMHQRYGVIAALRAADQYKLDEYTIWGGPWDIPYIASSVNEGVPAQSPSDSSGVVMLQWGARDPILGYNDQLYGIQDFPTRGYGYAYVNYMASVFLTRPYGNLVFGLENGGTLDTFSGYYQTMLMKARELQQEKGIHITTAKTFAQNFLLQKDVAGKTPYFLVQGYHLSDQAFWYNGISYRAYIQKSGNTISLIDLRNFASNSSEDFSILPNASPMLQIQENAVIDSKRSINQQLTICHCMDSLHTKTSGKIVFLYSGSKMIAQFEPDKLRVFLGSRQKTFTFQEQHTLSILLILVLFYAAYLLLLIKKIGFWKSLKEIGILAVPFIFASLYLFDSSTFLFDIKELPLFYLTLLMRSLPIKEALIVIKVIPFILLFLSHYFLRFSRKKIYYFVLSLVVLLYLHAPYFQLDKKAFIITSSFILGIAVVTSCFIMTKAPQIKQKALAVVGVLILSLLLLGTISISRTKYAITPFELEALQVIKDKSRDVLFVTQSDYGLSPIYRAVRPLIDNPMFFSEILTGVKWENVLRPESQVLHISHYDKKIILVARYLRADLSEYEQQSLRLKLLFDNAQIALYEKK